MTVKPIDIRTFYASGAAGRGKFRHKIQRGRIQSTNKIFISKEMESPAVARQEVLAQEFFRLLLPTQPETRLAHHPVLGTYYVLSEEVPNYCSLPNTPDEFTRGGYLGLGQIMLGSLFLQEIDLKNGNIGLSGNQVVKIDGDWCFASIREPSFYSNKPNQTITANMIAKLPYPTFYVFNWLDIQIQNVAYPTSTIINPATLCNASLFRLEVNQAMLKILLLPDAYLEKFVEAFIPVGGIRFINFLKQRRKELELSALQNESFRAYLSSMQAASDKDVHWNYIRDFVVHGTEKVLSKRDHEPLKSLIDSSFDRLRQNIGLDARAKRLPQAISRETHAARTNTQIEVNTKQPVKKGWKSFLGGFIFGAALISALILLRVIDVMTFGLSMPLTITLSAAIVLSAGLVAGAMATTLWPIGTKQSAKPTKENYVLKLKPAQDQFVQTIRDQLSQFFKRSKAADSFLNPVSKVNPEFNSKAAKTESDYDLFKPS
ncbi:TMEM198/TM7SF3 family protein [Legionella yabuuchiae]|uniref:TMEM198/TM7SF3 family protein n=1 Tax=Legionella yabuuchiae TaxID=376727 RepID=UPI001055E518|nr:TMEM198/TM7SF3 family protein [Legionella yabuuchiae]